MAEGRSFLKKIWPPKPKAEGSKNLAQAEPFGLGGPQASKIILEPFCLKYWGAQTLLLL